MKGLVADLRQESEIEMIDVLARWSASGRPTHEDWVAWYWPTDMHHTAKGYAVLASTIVDGLLESGWMAEVAPALSR
jgi:hypothetical protein